MPAEGVLQYRIINIENISVDEKVVQAIITDGFEARVIEVVLPINRQINITDAQLNKAWNRANPVDMALWRRVGHRDAQKRFDDATDAIFEVIEASAEPSIADVIAAAKVFTNGTRKQLEWDKITGMLRAATDAERQEFVAMIALIVLSRG